DNTIRVINLDIPDYNLPNSRNNNNQYIGISSLYSNEPSNVNNTTDFPATDYLPTEAPSAAVASSTTPIATSTNKYNNYNNKKNNDNNTIDSPAADYLPTKAFLAAHNNNNDNNEHSDNNEYSDTNEYSDNNEHNDNPVKQKLPVELRLITKAEIGLKISSNNPDNFVKPKRKKQRHISIDYENNESSDPKSVVK
ncbi:33935_t:CDS:2, partial [Racocetra persica]